MCVKNSLQDMLLNLIHAQAYFSVEPMFFPAWNPLGNAAVEPTHIAVHSNKQR
jgi:hypothetical protein